MSKSNFNRLIRGKIDHLDNKIIELIYQLYELTSEEIKIVEGSIA